MSPPGAAPRGRRGLLRDWRVALGLAVTLAALWWTLRGVEPHELLAALTSVNMGWVLLTIPFHWGSLWFRAVRWRHLTGAIAREPLPLGALYRATAIGFLAINLFPLRIGELVRPWVLARETPVRGSAALGTLVLERAIDFTVLAAIGAVVLLAHAGRLPPWVRSGALGLAALACVPFALAFVVHRAPTRSLGLLQRIAGVLPRRFSERAVEMLLQVLQGLGALRGRRSVLWVALWSVWLWGVVIAAPFALGLYAFHLELSPPAALLATYTALVFVALAVAAPSAPGFVGVYHFACREALTLFGVSSATAVAYGTVLHLSYWFPVTLFGFAASVSSGARISELTSAPLGKAGPDAHR